MALTIEQFGQKVKSKYPQYKDVDDAELGRKVIEKYPEYKSQVSLEQPKLAPKKDDDSARFGTQTLNPLERATAGAGRGIISTATGGSGLFQRGANSLLKTVLPKRAEKAFGLDKAPTLRNNIPSSAEQLVPKELRSPGQDPYGKAGFYGEQVAEFFIPAGPAAKVSKGVDVAVNAIKTADKVKDLGKAGKVVKPMLDAAKVGAKVGTRAGIEAGSSAGVTAVQGGSGEEIKNAALFGAVGGVASKGIEAVAARLPKTAWANVLKRSKAEVAKNPLLPEQASKLKMSALSTSGLLKKAKNNIQQIELELDELLKGTQEVVDGKKVASYLDELKQSYSVIPGEKNAVEVIDSIQKEMITKGTMPAQQANKLKREIYKLIQKSYGKGDLEIPAKRDAQKALARGLKTEIENLTGLDKVKDLNAKQAVLIKIKKALDNRLSLGEGKGAIPGLNIGLYDILTGIGGGIVGFGAGRNVALEAGAFLAKKKLLGSTAFLTNLSRFTERFNQMSPTQKMMFYHALQGLIIESVNSTPRESPRTKEKK